jgi:hypothetical protein
MGENSYPLLNERSRGWLRHLWRKATTPDDWSRLGEPHPWWDRYTMEPMLSFPRFDLEESSYAVAMMADVTPAWREVYTRILDELLRRHTAYWAAVDFLSHIGDDPDRESYSEDWLKRLIPEELRGRYDVPGWMANGTEPWGLQPDPIGAEGNLFFKAWFNLVLSFYRYVSGDGRWSEPFQMAGLDDQLFEWTHGRVAEHLAVQWSHHEPGLHCENTKVWPM